MFAGAEAFNQPINSWDTSSVRDMAGMFWGAIVFNQPLYKWLTIFVENMGGMFAYAESFNQNINDWNVSNVKNMYFCEYGDSEKYIKYALGVENKLGLELGLNDRGMFNYAKSFNQPLDKWNVSGVTDMGDAMFYGTKLEATQSLPKWYHKWLLDNGYVYDAECNKYKWVRKP